MAKYLRPLDPLERLHLALYNTKVYNNVQVGLVYSCSPFKPPHRPDYPQKHTPMAPFLAGPLAWLVQQHPPLVVVGDILSATPAYWRACAENLHQTQVEYVTLSEAETLQVLKMTMHSLLMTAAVFAIKAAFVSSGGDASADVSTNDEMLRTATLVNVRPLVTPAIDRLEHGNYVSGTQHKEVSIHMDTLFWEVARL
ncbi:hypothetical protein BGZ59_007504 [Podila verticillata]|nr:hypothetical protein BGZ59_007504 [Podila verticillata]